MSPNVAVVVGRRAVRNGVRSHTGNLFGDPAMSFEVQPVAIVISETRFSEPQDRDLERRVTTFLASQHRPGLRAVKVHACQGVVTLSGQVGSFYEKQLSVQLSRRVAGVIQLDDELVVRAYGAARQESRVDRRKVVNLGPILPLV